MNPDGVGTKILTRLFPAVRPPAGSGAMADKEEAMRRITLITTLMLAAHLMVAASGAESPRYQENLRRPRILWIARPNDRMIVERLVRELPARIVFATPELRDLELHHLADKPLEEKRETVAAVQARNRKYLTRLINDLEAFDVVVLAAHPQRFDRQMAQKIVDWVKAGGKLVYMNPSWEITFQGTPLAEVMPAKAGKHKAWTYTQAGATKNPLVRGLPLEVTGSHWYGPVYEAVDEKSVPLTVNKAARFWVRRLDGGGCVVFLPVGIFGTRWEWRGEAYATYKPERPDADRVWFAFLRRVVYTLTHGQKAYPVLLRLQVPLKRKIPGPGEQISIPVSISHMHGAARRVRLCLEIRNRRVGMLHRSQAKVHLRPGEERKLVFAMALPEVVAPRNVLVQAVARDADTGRVIAESFTWHPVRPSVALSVEAEKASCLPGEKIPVSVRWGPASAPGRYAARACLVDCRGRIIQYAEAEQIIEAGKAGAWQVSLTMPDWGPGRDYAFWPTAIFERDGKVWAYARTQVYNDKAWHMRQEFQFSLWASSTQSAPCLAGRIMELFADAGFNSLGYGGISYWAERYGWRRYVESTGINTFGVEISHETWQDVQRTMASRIDRLNKGGVDSRSKALVSLGEESGFKGGWGKRYYWAEDEAPAIPQKVFNQYLKELYQGNLKLLNEEWGADYASFDQVPLSQTRSRGPEKVFVMAQAWAAKKERQPWHRKVDLSKISAEKRYLARTAPFYETNSFYDWYYEKYCDLATKVYRQRRNPAPRTIMSAPGGFYPKVDVYNFAGLGPFYPKETSMAGNAVARRDYGDVPGFSGAMWAYFDLRRLWFSTVWSSIAAGNTHIDYWVDFPLTFNPDLSHTRASFWTKVLRGRLRPLEPVLLHRRVVCTPGLGLYIPTQPLSKGIRGDFFPGAISPNAILYGALEKSGYLPKVVNTADLGKVKVLFASFAQVVSPQEAKHIRDFVARGGLLVSTPWLASCTPHGNLLSVYPAPATHLDDVLGFRLLQTSQLRRKEVLTVARSAELPLRESLSTLSVARDTVLDLKPKVKVLAKFADGTPAILTHPFGRGKAVHLNFIFNWSGWWNTFYEPQREGFRRLIEAIVKGDGRVKQEYFLGLASYEGPPATGWWGTKGLNKLSNWKPADAIPYWATAAYADPAGKARYLFIYADHRSPRITATLSWSGAPGTLYDAFKHKKIPWRDDGRANLTLAPGGGAFRAVLSDPPRTLSLKMPKRTIKAGARLEVRVHLRNRERQSVSGDHGVMLEVIGPDGKRSRNHGVSNWTVSGGRGKIAIPFALNDPAGTYRIVATECITGISAEARVKVKAARVKIPRTVLEPFVPAPSETWPPPPMSAKEFLNGLRRLRSLYLTRHTGLEAKYRLSYFLYTPFTPASRHAIMHNLAQLDWAKYAGAVARALRQGEYFYLMGEDLGLDPDTGRRVDPFGRPRPYFLEALSRVRGARTKRLKVKARTITVISLGKGRFIFDPVSVDRAAYLSGEFASWQKNWLHTLRSSGLLQKP